MAVAGRACRQEGGTCVGPVGPGDVKGQQTRDTKETESVNDLQRNNQWDIALFSPCVRLILRARPGAASPGFPGQADRLEAQVDWMLQS